jgi:hypothetical protein
VPCRRRSAGGQESITRVDSLQLEQRINAPVLVVGYRIWVKYPPAAADFGTRLGKHKPARVSGSGLIAGDLSGPGRDRTSVQRIMSPLLYRLSYRPGWLEYAVSVGRMQPISGQTNNRSGARLDRPVSFHQARASSVHAGSRPLLSAAPDPVTTPVRGVNQVLGYPCKWGAFVTRPRLSSAASHERSCRPRRLRVPKGRLPRMTAHVLDDATNLSTDPAPRARFRCVCRRAGRGSRQ